MLDICKLVIHKKFSQKIVPKEDDADGYDARIERVEAKEHIT